MSGSAADFPLLYPILITPLTGSNTTPRSFAINTSFEPYRRDAFRHRTIPSQRESIAVTDIPGEGTVNTEGLWRRGAYSWHHGAGQLYADRGASSNADPFRFYESKGVDPWTEYQLGLLPDTTLQVAATASRPWVATAVVEGYVYVLATTALGSGSPATTITYYSGSYASGTVPTGLSGQIYWIFTDGYWVYAAGTAGLFVTSPGGAAWQQVINVGVGANFCGIANGRVIMTNGPTVYDVTYQMGPFTGTATPKPLPTSPPNWSHPNPNWVWSSMCAGQGFIYLAGYSRNPSTLARGESGVYALGEFTSTAVLDPGFVALPIEKGEQVTALYFYLNKVYVGTTNGVRQCSIAGTNNPDSQSGCLLPGPLIPNNLQPLQPVFATPVSNVEVKGFIGFDRYVWFTWNYYDGTSCGLGRLDTATLNGPDQPAYASDLMVSQSGGPLENLEWCPITNGPLMINGTGGLYTQNPGVYVASGTLDSGRFTFGIPDPKMIMQANLKTAEPGTILPDGESPVTIGGTVTLTATADGSTTNVLSPLAPMTEANPPILVTPLVTGEEWNILLTLSSASSGTVVPFVTRYTVKALPQIVAGATISPVLKLYVTDESHDIERYNDPYGDYGWLENLRLGQIPCAYTEGSAADGATQYSATIVITEIDWLPFKERDNLDAGFEGDLVLYVKTIVG